MEFIVFPKNVLFEQQSACGANLVVPVAVCGANAGSIVSLPGACAANYGIVEVCGAFSCMVDN